MSGLTSGNTRLQFKQPQTYQLHDKKSWNRAAVPVQFAPHHLCLLPTQSWPRSRPPCSQRKLVYTFWGDIFGPWLQHLPASSLGQEPCPLSSHTSRFVPAFQNSDLDEGGLMRLSMILMVLPCTCRRSKMMDGCCECFASLCGIKSVRRCLCVAGFWFDSMDVFS